MFKELHAGFHNNTSKATTNISVYSRGGQRLWLSGEAETAARGAREYMHGVHTGPGLQ